MHEVGAFCDFSGFFHALESLFLLSGTRENSIPANLMAFLQVLRTTINQFKPLGNVFKRLKSFCE
jgi:hypothetical protein